MIGTGCFRHSNISCRQISRAFPANSSIADSRYLKQPIIRFTFALYRYLQSALLDTSFLFTVADIAAMQFNTNIMAQYSCKTATGERPENFSISNLFFKVSQVVSIPQRRKQRSRKSSALNSSSDRFVISVSTSPDLRITRTTRTEYVSVLVDTVILKSFDGFSFTPLKDESRIYETYGRIG